MIQFICFPNDKILEMEVRLMFARRQDMRGQVAYGGEEEVLMEG